MRQPAANETGVTLLELLVVLLIVGILVAIAVPAFTRDQAKGEYEQLVDKLAADLQAARFQAIASKDLREINIDTATAKYQLNSIIGGVPAQLRSQDFPPNAEVAGYKTGEATAPPITVTPTSIQFSMIGDLQLKAPGLGTCDSVDCSVGCPCTITIFLHSKDDRYRSRLVVYKATGYTRRLEGWQ